MPWWIIHGCYTMEFQKLKQEAIKYGLVINQNKTKYMSHLRVQTNVKNKEIEIEGMKIEEVNSANISEQLRMLKT